jgi:hypothetical protein
VGKGRKKVGVVNEKRPAFQLHQIDGIILKININQKHRIL